MKRQGEWGGFEKSMHESDAGAIYARENQLSIEKKTL